MKAFYWIRYNLHYIFQQSLSFFHAYVISVYLQVFKLAFIICFSQLPTGEDWVACFRNKVPEE